jgi:integrase/recombinase XerD
VRTVVASEDRRGAVAPESATSAPRTGRSPTNSSTSVALVPVDRCLADGEQLALAGFLAGYRGSTHKAYALDLRQFAVWCANHERRLFEVHRVDIECFGRDLETRGRARATIARRLCTIASFYRYAEEEGLVDHSPAIHVRRPRLDYESHATGLDRNELGTLLVAAGLSSARDYALVSLLALNGLRVSEAVSADIDALGLERCHRTLTVTRKGSRVVTMPLAPRVARALDLAIGERLEGPIFVDGAGERLDRHAAGRIVRRVARLAGITKHVGPHTLRHAFITAALDAGVPLRDVQEAASHADPRTTMRYDRGRQSLDRLPLRGRWLGAQPQGEWRAAAAPWARTGVTRGRGGGPSGGRADLETLRAPGSDHCTVLRCAAHRSGRGFRRRSRPSSSVPIEIDCMTFAAA